MKLDVIECGSCLAPVTRGAAKCEYCGAVFNIDWKTMDVLAKPKKDAGYRISIEQRIEPGLSKEQFESTFIEKYRLTEKVRRTFMTVALYKFDDEVLIDQAPLFDYDPSSVPTFDVKKTGLVDLVKFVETTAEHRLAFIDLFASINDAHVKKYITSGKPLTIPVGVWYERNAHIDNIINMMQYTGKESIVLFERIKLSMNPSTGEREMNFPASHKVVYHVDEIIDIPERQKMKSRDFDRAWGWHNTKMAAMDLTPNNRW
nr:hypothetical protein [Candidatus Sigynarchaeota archaeon]